MLLILTASDDVTADYLVSRIDSKLSFVRIDTDQIEFLGVEFDGADAIVSCCNASFNTTQVSSVWYRRPSPIIKRTLDSLEYHRSREMNSAFEGALSLIPRERWMNYPANNAMASLKMEQICRASRIGLSVPESIVTSTSTNLRSFWDLCDGQVIVKPLYAGFIENQTDGSCDWVIYTNKLEPEHLDNAEIALPDCPTLFQRRIPKLSDVRVTIIDDFIFAVRLTESDEQPIRQDIRANNMEGVVHTTIELPNEIEDLCKTLLRSYGLRFGALDFLVDRDSKWWYLELNPNGQWAWQDILGVTDMSAAFMDSFLAASINAYS